MTDNLSLDLSGVELFSTWHLNLNYSSIESNQRRVVIEKCYWPLLNLAEDLGCPQGIEISASSLKTIAELDPSWLDKFRKLHNSGLVELISSGYEQIVGPLAPARVNSTNLTFGKKVVNELLGVEPSLAFVNEQCASRGLLGLIKDVGFDGAVIEWESAWVANPNWHHRIGRFAQRYLQPEGLVIVWNRSRWFQALQRYSHTQIDLESLVHIYQEAANAGEGAYCFYGGDVETFDYRARRFLTESNKVDGEWARVREAIQLTIDAGANWKLPGDYGDVTRTQGIDPFTFENQILTKKQPKYNAVRWSVSGRANYAVNNYAFSQLEGLSSDIEKLAPSETERILTTWASDFRTHITDSRWNRFVEERPGLLSAVRGQANRRDSQAKNQELNPGNAPVLLENSQIALEIDAHRGFTLDSARLKCPCSIKLIGRVPYGFLEGPLYSPDWFTGNFVHSPSGLSQDSDISFLARDYWCSPNGLVSGTEILTKNFAVTKAFELSQHSAEFQTRFVFEWKVEPMGALRAGFTTFKPDAWAWEHTFFENHDGGFDANRYKVTDSTFDQGAPPTHGVTATNLSGITEGKFAVQDENHRVTISLDDSARGAALMLAMSGEKPNLLFRTFFSLQEADDTFRGPRGRFLSFSYKTSFECLK